ncbi:MAG TPA: ribonuclease P protein component [Candidatus Limnocylindrales bacterium]|nr:ribonuclease P protein component [Candidatus Limnocylindrales bacterium]
MKRRQRLRRSADFARALRAGYRIGTPSVTLFIRDNDYGSPRVGFAVSRKLGNAVVRNRIKRRLRAIVRPLAERTRAGRDIVIVAKAPAVDAGGSRLKEELEEVWQQGVDRK